MTIASAIPASTPSSLRALEIHEFLERAGWEEYQLAPLAGDASFRRYIRIHHPGGQAMLMDAPPEKENVRPYLAVTRFLHAEGYSTPRVLAENADAGLLLLEDLGDDLFTQLLAGNAQARDLEDTLYQSAINVLADWHTQPSMQQSARKLTLPLYDYALLMQEVGLFSDWYLPAVAGNAKASAMRESFLALWRDLLTPSVLRQEFFVHRDFHASNLMWLPERKQHARVGLLDFQDAVWGDAAYDVVSLLEDARRDVPASLAERMLDAYIHATGCDREHFLHTYALLGAQRNCKIIGIFVRLWKRDGKRHYLPLLPRVWRYLEQDVSHPALQPLRAWLDQHIPPAWRDADAVHV